MSSCALCGHTTHEADRNIRFRLPDPVLDLAEGDETDGVWKSEADPNRAVMMTAPTLGGFIRALLPVHLHGGETVTFGVWVGVHSEDLKRAYDLWWDPAYPNLKLSGRLANALPQWGLLAAPVELEVVDPDATPYCVSSSDATMAAVLTSLWDRDEVHSHLPN